MTIWWELEDRRKNHNFSLSHALIRVLSSTAFGQGHQHLLATLDFWNFRTLLPDWFLTPFTRNHTIWTPIASPTPVELTLTSPRKYDECIAEPGVALSLVSPTSGYRTRRALALVCPPTTFRLGNTQPPFLEQEPERAQQLAPFIGSTVASTDNRFNQRSNSPPNVFRTNQRAWLTERSREDFFASVKWISVDWRWNREGKVVRRVRRPLTIIENTVGLC